MRAGQTLAILGVVALAAVSGCTRNASDAKPTASAGVPPAMTVATVDFPSTWVSERVGGAAVEVERMTATELPSTSADLVAYIPGLDPQVDAAVETLPPERLVDLTGDIGLIASPSDPASKDPHVWFDPVNVGTMAQTLGQALGEASPTPFEAFQYHGLRALSVQTEALDVDQRLQEQFNPCRIPTLVVEAPVLTYLARAYAFTQVPLTRWKPGAQPVRAAYFTPEAEPAVRDATGGAGVAAVGVETLITTAPGDDLLQGVLDVADTVAAHQDCPLATPSTTDRPG